VQAFYVNGAIFVPLAAIADAALMAVAVLHAARGSDTGATGVTSARSPQSRLIGFLRRKTMLLVLDNLEQDGKVGVKDTIRRGPRFHPRLAHVSSHFNTALFSPSA
jgi:hypothetical protein